MIFLAGTLLVFGCLFILFGVLGVLRLPDFYCRLHAMGKCDTLGMACVLAALAIYEGWTLTSVKILTILLFLALTNPSATHALGRAAWRAGLKPWKKPEDP